MSIIKAEDIILMTVDTVVAADTMEQIKNCINTESPAEVPKIVRSNSAAESAGNVEYHDVTVPEAKNVQAGMILPVKL